MSLLHTHEILINVGLGIINEAGPTRQATSRQNKPTLQRLTGSNKGNAGKSSDESKVILEALLSICFHHRIIGIASFICWSPPWTQYCVASVTNKKNVFWQLAVLTPIPTKEVRDDLLLKVSISRNMKQKIYEILTSPKIQTNGVILNNCID